MNTKNFFVKDKSFYKTLFSLFIVIALQNIVTYSVNMADNIMLGTYKQTALSGAASVNQIFFLIQQLANSIGEGIVIIGTQYWGQNRPDPIRKLTGTALKLAFVCGIVVTMVCSLFPVQLVSVFSTDANIIEEGVKYLNILKFTFFTYMISAVLMAAMRSVRTVNISFATAVVSLIINVCINYTLIFGKFGFPEMGIEGAAIGTLVSRIVEMLILIAYVFFVDKKLSLRKYNFLKPDKQLTKDYYRAEVHTASSSFLWAVSVPMQGAIMGHLSAEAIAANSVSTTFYSYLKVIVTAMASTSGVLIGNSVGVGDVERVKQEGKTLSVICICIGIVLGAALVILRKPLLSIYSLTPETVNLADKLILVMSVVMVGMSYQMPVSMGVIRGGGDIKFASYMNVISVWLIVMPLSFAAAFWWKLSVPLVTLVIQSDQIFKGLPVFIRFKSYKWIKKLTRE